MGKDRGFWSFSVGSSLGNLIHSASSILFRGFSSWLLTWFTITLSKSVYSSSSSCCCSWSWGCSSLCWTKIILISSGFLFNLSLFISFYQLAYCYSGYFWSHHSFIFYISFSCSFFLLHYSCICLHLGCPIQLLIVILGCNLFWHWLFLLCYISPFFSLLLRQHTVQLYLKIILKLNRNRKP